MHFLHYFEFLLLFHEKLVEKDAVPLVVSHLRIILVIYYYIVYNMHIEKKCSNE